MNTKWVGRSTVPRLYKVASKVLQRAKEEKGSLKTFIYEANHPNIKAIHSLTVEALKRSALIDDLATTIGLFEAAPRLNPHLAHILITELLWGKKKLSRASQPERLVTELMQKHHSTVAFYQEDKCEAGPKKPRYVRINTILSSIKHAKRSFSKDGWELIEYDSESVTYSEYLERIKELQGHEYIMDYHVEGLCVFPPGTEFHKDSMYHSGRIFLQDKASCIPMLLLRAEPGSSVIDACAAPGMKTTQLAAIMQNEGHIRALDLDSRRFETLQAMVEKAGATCVENLNLDFLTLEPSEYADVDYILVDPSCSGSGQVNRINLSGGQEEADPDRLQQLASFQAMILSHACSFPNVKRIVYSTCSLYEKENEQVIERVLEKWSGSFKVVRGLGKKVWPNRGSREYGWARRCMYARPEEDLCDGFFVAVLERVTSPDNDE